MGREQAPVIRRALASEWQALRELRLRALESDPLAFGSTLEEELRFDELRWRSWATQGAESSTTSQWVAEEAPGTLVGSVVLSLVEGQVFVFAMWVAPDARGRGIGAKLLDAGLSWAARTFPGQETRLDVNPRQAAAVHLYESRGFRRSAPDRPLGHAPGESRYEMVRPPSRP